MLEGKTKQKRTATEQQIPDEQKVVCSCDVEGKLCRVYLKFI